MNGSSVVGILPLLVSGYIFNLICYPLRFFCSRADGQRLFFMSALSGLLLGALSFLIASGLRHVAFAHPLIGEFAASLSGSIPVPHAAVLLFSIFVALVLALFGNALFFIVRKLSSVEATTPKWVYGKLMDRFGTPLALLRRKAANEQKLVMITLKSRKVYCGRVLEVPSSLHHDNAYIEFLPKFSTYRNKDHLKLGRDRTEYPAIAYWQAQRYVASQKEVLAEFDKRIGPEPTWSSEAADEIRSVRAAICNEIKIAEEALGAFGAPANFSIDDWTNVIPVDEIESATFHDPDAYEVWFGIPSVSNENGGDVLEGVLSSIGRRDQRHWKLSITSRPK